MSIQIWLTLNLPNMKNFLFSIVLVLTSWVLMVCSSCADPIDITSFDLGKVQQEYGSPQVDLAVDKHPLMINGRAYARGLGTHAKGLGNFRWFLFQSGWATWRRSNQNPASL
jgi:hypothetical protein